MKNKAFAAVRATLSAALATAAVCCPLTALRFDFSLWTIVLCAGLTSVVCGGISILLKRKAFVISTGALSLGLALFIILNLSTLISELNFAVNSALELYSIAYPLPQSVSFADETANSASFLFAVVTIISSAIITFSTVRARVIYPSLIVSLILIAPSFVLVDTPPNTFAFASAIVIILALFASKFLISNNVSSGSAVLLSAIALLSAAAVIICAIFPPENYKPFPWQENLRSKWESGLGVDNLSGRGRAVAKKSFEMKDTLDLSQEDGFHHTGERVMRVLSSVSGKEYLRETSYGAYDGAGKWSLLDEGQYEFLNETDRSPLFSYQNGSTYSLSIRTEKRTDYAYFPYNAKQEPKDLYSQYDICLANPYKRNEYSFEVLNGTVDESGSNIDSYNRFVKKYTYLPSNVLWAFDDVFMNNELTISSDLIENLETVRSYVSGLAHYSETTERCPADRDFVEWFINDAESGYCVHYASAAVCMLRYLGIPARFVTGYCANTTAGEWVDVTDKNAHAWAEYYVPGAGWQALEATPSSYNPFENEPEQTTQATSYAPASETEPASQPNQTQPSAKPKAETETEKKADLSGAITVFKIVIIIVSAAALLFLYIYILSIVRKMKFNQSSNNKTAQNIYRYLKRLKTPPPREAENIAMKARFSQHKVTDEEIILLKNYYQTERKKHNKLILLLSGL